MPYRKIPLINGHYYHIYNRGVEKRIIFMDHKDYLTFLAILRWYLLEDLERPGLSRVPKISLKNKVAMLGFILMPNHFHFLLRQEKDEGVSKFMRVISVAYAMYFNQRHHRVGSLFQGRFQAKLIEKDEYLLQLSKYIHRNAKEITPATQNLLSYPYSSYINYVTSQKDMMIDSSTILSYFSQKNPQISYQNFVEEHEVDKENLSNFLFEE